MARSELADQFEEIANGAFEEAESVDCDGAEFVAGLRLMAKILTMRAKEAQANLKSGAEDSAVVDDDDELDVDGEVEDEEGDE